MSDQPQGARMFELEIPLEDGCRIRLSGDLSAANWDRMMVLIYNADGDELTSQQVMDLLPDGRPDAEV